MHARRQLADEVQVPRANAEETAMVAEQLISASLIPLTGRLQRRSSSRRCGSRLPNSNGSWTRANFLYRLMAETLDGFGVQILTSLQEDQVFDTLDDSNGDGFPRSDLELDAVRSELSSRRVNGSRKREIAVSRGFRHFGPIGPTNRQMEAQYADPRNIGYPCSFNALFVVVVGSSGTSTSASSSSSMSSSSSTAAAAAAAAAAGRGRFLGGFGSGSGHSRNRGTQTGGVFGHRLFRPLNEMRPFALGGQLGRPGVGRLFLRCSRRCRPA